MTENSEDVNNLTTDAFPSPPRANTEDLQFGTTSQRTNSGENSRKHSSGSSSNTRTQRDSESEDSDSCQRKHSSSNQRRFSSKSYEGVPAPNAFASVINITNATGVQIGSNYTYIVKSSKEKHSKKTKEYPKTDKIISLLNSKELVTEEDIQFISTHMDETWMETARKLDYSNGQISQFHCDYINNGLKEVIYQFLLDWIQHNGEDATVSKLCDALWNSGQRDCVSRWSQK
ncbi:hypothetical protein WA026_008718 [Henosepilachna vigintioctopunctata]|uniref:Death domain-containing protein n=1 Tax=Henosepilachna vigintioctopunctata TaxID=420089 RepID=A0AAW1VB20_9CUCU